ncbi:MAG: hypothetical protein ABI834_10760 [Ginsengibacter sp.]
MKIDEYLHLYLGCNTNLGQLVGVNATSYFILLENKKIIQRIFNDEPQVKLLLRKISDLNIEESAELNKKGFSIGRPRGYSFSPEAILYLLALRIDLFNLIAEGLATDVNQ